MLICKTLESSPSTFHPLNLSPTQPLNLLPSHPLTHSTFYPLNLSTFYPLTLSPTQPFTLSPSRASSRARTYMHVLTTAYNNASAIDLIDGTTHVQCHLHTTDDAQVRDGFEVIGDRAHQHVVLEVPGPCVRACVCVCMYVCMYVCVRVMCVCVQRKTKNDSRIKKKIQPRTHRCSSSEESF